MDHSSVFAGIGVGLGLIILLVVALAFVFWIWMLIDCIKNPRLGDLEKIVWLLVIFFLHLLGALIYFFAGRASRNVV